MRCAIQENRTNLFCKKGLKSVSLNIIVCSVLSARNDDADIRLFFSQWSITNCSVYINCSDNHKYVFECVVSCQSFHFNREFCEGGCLPTRSILCECDGLLIFQSQKRCVWPPGNDSIRLYLECAFPIFFKLLNLNVVANVFHCQLWDGVAMFSLIKSNSGVNVNVVLCMWVVFS